ncbi:hypothetical protein DV736_g1243, partial [Chaetothyriales sp. CBS 134916]
MVRIREQTGWETIDLEGDILVSTRKRKAALTQFQPTYIQPAKLADSVGLSSTTPPTSSSPQLALKKRRLAISQNVIDAENSLLPETSQSAAKVDTLNQGPEFLPETLPDTSTSSLDPSDESLVRNLARLLNMSMSKPKTESNNDVDTMHAQFEVLESPSLQFMFERCGPESQVAQEVDRLKSQKKDLKIIQNIFHYIATLCAVGELFTKDEDELKECKKFVHLVVDQGQPGRAMRSRMQQIRDNMLARIGRINETYLPDDHNKVEELYEGYLGSRRASEILAALKRIDDEIHEVSTQRSNLQKTRYTSKKVPIKKTSPRQPSVKCNHAKKYHFDRVVEESNGCTPKAPSKGMKIDLGSHPTPRTRAKRHTKGDREIHALSETLRVFQARAPASNTQCTRKDNNEDGSGSDIPEHRADQISQQSSDFMHHGQPSGANIENQDMNETKRLEDTRERDEARVSAPVSQLFDPELVARMKQRTLEAGRVVVTGEEEGDEEQVELSDWNDTDSDISSASRPSVSSFDGTVQLYKYTIRGQFVGTQSYNDGDIITFKTFWKLRNATVYLQDVIKSLHREYMGNLDDHFELQHRHHKGLYEQVLTIGANHDVQARLWTDRELVLVDTCKLAASKARKRQLAESDEVYQVTWEKITTTTIATTTNTSLVVGTATLSSQEQPNNHNNHCIVDTGLSSDAPTATTTTIERCPDPVIHRNLASANRMAKEDFMTWYSQFFPVEEHKHSYITEQGTLFFDYSGMLKQINEAHEDALKRLGDVGCFMAEEEIALTETKDDNVAAATGGRITKMELMKVYVKPVMVLGPKN